MGALIPTETLQVVHISTAIHRSTVARARSEDALASVDTGDGPPGSRAEPGWAEIGFLRGYPSRLDTQSGWMPARMSVTMACRGIPKSPHAISARARGRRDSPDRVILAAEPALDLGEEACLRWCARYIATRRGKVTAFARFFAFGIGRLHTAKVAHAAHARWRCFFFVAPRGRRGPPAQGRRGKVYGRLTGYPELKPRDLRHGVGMWKCWSSTTMTSSRCAP